MHISTMLVFWSLVRNSVMLAVYLLFLVSASLPYMSIYTGVVTGIARLIFPKQANGSMIEIDGKRYGCELLGQQFTDDSHMWGRIMNIDVSAYKDEVGKTLMYAAPFNLSPVNKKYEALL